MYITAFASISSTALEIEVLALQNENKRSLRTQIKCDVENLIKPRRNPVWYGKHVFASEEYGGK